jgi:hypothetical protein
VPEVSRVTESYRKVPYDIRTAKQIERRMLMESLQLLAEGGFPISDYQYTGFGSIHFVDFILLHRFLGISCMLSAEHSRKIKKRVEFNRPFKTVDVVIQSATEVIPTLSPEKRHILWLDYDGPVEQSHLHDLALSGTYLSSGSILLLTVDVEPPGDERDGAKEWRDYFISQAGPLVGDATEVEDYAETKLLRRNIEIIGRAISNGMTGRRGLQFMPLYCFVYADGHEMLTLGGMVVDDGDAAKVKESKVPNLFFTSKSFADEPYRISPPILTRKERLFLDSLMPCADGWVPKEFELPVEEVAAYRELYRYYPLYAELLI